MPDKTRQVKIKSKFDPAKKPSLKGKNIEDYKRVVEILHSEILRRDKIIDTLREENTIIMKTAFKAEENAKNLEAAISKLKANK
ncbi:MAG: hypothetical protein V1859_00435 [archaeon]